MTASPARLLVVGAFVALAIPRPCSAQGAAAAAGDYAAYMEAHRYDCVGPFDRMATPQAVSIAGVPWQLEGSRMVVQRRDPDNEAKLGVLSAIKDMSPETRGNLHAFLDWFAQARIDALVVNGDLALDEDDLDALLELLGQRSWPIFVEIGNSESAGSFQRATRKAFGASPAIINLGWVRHVAGDDFELVSLPGYHDRRFAHTGSACIYKPEDIDATVHRLERAGTGPLLLVSHGPPAATGKAGIDLALDGSHVGDPKLAELARRLEIKFGIHGHILEGGGSAVGADLATPVKPDTFKPGLFVNAGTANGLPWRLNDGRVLCGLAAIVHLKGATAAVSYNARSCPEGE